MIQPTEKMLVILSTSEPKALQHFVTMVHRMNVRHCVKLKTMEKIQPLSELTITFRKRLL